MLLATSLLATTGAAQQVRGRLLRQADSSAVGDALVLLLDAGRREVGRAATTASGGFQLQGTGTGRYTVRVQRIGFQGWETPPVDLAAGAPWSVTLYLPEEPFVLPELTSRATRPACGLSLSDPALSARMLEAAQTALGLAEAEAAAGRHRYMVQTWRRALRPDG
ncbi:MAG TPA: carboxypeptidase-like regulatory domain-containing protein, partial [Gemmatimonadales bacterium]|nr:carboxypeptidase-like regulatory domain-containing protein [Gemmatimonadales bacterium]